MTHNSMPIEHIGVQRTTWSEIKHKAKHEWKEYCRIMDAFAEDHQPWLDYRGRGVSVERPHVLKQRSKT